MDTEKCRLLLQVIDAGSLSAAAVRLGYTPSGVLRAVNSIERALGFAVLRRSTRGVTLTKEGELLLPKLREFVHWGRQVEETGAQICGLEIGELAVGTYFSVAANWLPPVIRSFQETYPHVRIHLEEGGNKDLYRWLEERRIQCCIATYRPFKGDWLALRQDEMVLWLPPNHREAKKKAVSLTALKEDTFINTLPDLDTDTDNLLRKVQSPMEPRFTSVDNYTTYRMVEAGLGFGINNRLMTASWHGKVAVRSFDPPQYITLGVAVPSLEEASPVTKTFVNYLKSGVADGL